QSIFDRHSSSVDRLPIHCQSSRTGPFYNVRRRSGRCGKIDPAVENIGRYRIIGELGRGAMGVVYKAQDPAIGRMIAVKSIRLGELTEESERERLRERLFREAQSAGILSHPGILTIYDIAEEGGL